MPLMTAMNDASAPISGALARHMACWRRWLAELIAA